MPTPEVTRFWIAQTWPAVSWRNIHCFLKGKSLISMHFATLCSGFGQICAEANDGRPLCKCAVGPEMLRGGGVDSKHLGMVHWTMLLDLQLFSLLVTV